MLLRKLLLAVFSFEKYLRIISYIFLKTFVHKIYLKEHYQVKFLSKMIKDGDYCIDIGANLGYFSIPISQLIGKSGKLFSIEPVELFREVLLRNVAYFSGDNVEVMPYALGEEDEKEIMLGTPNVDGVIRHGRTEVLENTEENTDLAYQHKAVMMKPETLFSDLPRLNFIKCDVEGYELHIIPHFLSLIEKFRPILEIEIDPLSHKLEIIDMLSPLKYSAFFLKDEQLIPFQKGNSAHEEEIELYFFPKEKINDYAFILA
ncbi:FkbM family methyltransferase [Flexithrix dorotheae]|uniref:FkbM family methyltransferase n=1 Tax=Flexithrix dorotheae TaxID=70993 RepID=UPI0003812898|nr:FkbM family methyltransferase [Flexithrix dorotheae]